MLFPSQLRLVSSFWLARNSGASCFGKNSVMSGHLVMARHYLPIYSRYTMTRMKKGAHLLFDDITAKDFV
jgi:hypothetical protein